MFTGPVPHGRPSPHDDGQPYPAHTSTSTSQDHLNSSRAAARARRSGRGNPWAHRVPILVREDIPLWLVNAELGFAKSGGQEPVAGASLLTKLRPTQLGSLALPDFATAYPRSATPCPSSGSLIRDRSRSSERSRSRADQGSCARSQGRSTRRARLRASLLRKSREDLAESAAISYRTIARERINGPLGGSRETNEALFQRSNRLGSFLSAGVQLRACEWMRTKAAS